MYDCGNVITRSRLLCIGRGTLGCHPADIRFDSIKISHVIRRKKRTNQRIYRRGQESFLYWIVPLALLQRKCSVMRNKTPAFFGRRHAFLNPANSENTRTRLVRPWLTSALSLNISLVQICPSCIKPAYLLAPEIILLNMQV